MKNWREWLKRHPNLVLAGSIALVIVGSSIVKAGVESVGSIIGLIGIIGIVLFIMDRRSQKRKGIQSETTAPIVKDIAIAITGPSDEESKEAFDTSEGGDNKWQEYGEQCRKHIQDKNYGLYRNTRYNMAMFVKKENKFKNALNLLTEVIFWDLTGCGNNFDYSSFFSITLSSLFPYEKSIMTLAPGVIREVGTCQKELGFSDEQLKAQMLEYLRHMTAPIQFFTYSEISDIFFWERDQNTDQLKKVYAAAKKQFDPKHPNAAARG